jgi:hypothetical protein
MHKLFVLFSTGLLVLGMAGSASAARLNWEGTFTVQMIEFGDGSGSGGGVATINGSAGVVPAHLSTLLLAGSRGHVTGTNTNIVTDPETAGNGIAAVIYEGIQGGTGSFGNISGGAASTGAMSPNNEMPIRGVVKICLLSTACTEYLSLPFTQPTTVNGVPGTGLKGAGLGGMMTVGGYGGIRISLQYGPWTIKTTTMIDQITTPGGSRVFTNKTQQGWAHAPVSTTTSTAEVGGMIQLVTPVQGASNLALGSYDKIGASALFVVRFIPEPGLLLLLGSGVAGLVFLGRARMRR